MLGSATAPGRPGARAGARRRKVAEAVGSSSRPTPRWRGIDAETAEAGPVRPASRTARTGFLARLFVLVLVAMLPAMAIQAYNEIAGRESREAEVREDALRLAQFASGEMDRIVENGAASSPPSPICRRSAISTGGLLGLRHVAAKKLSAICGIGAIDSVGHPFCSNIPIPADTTPRPGLLSAGQGHRDLHGRRLHGRSPHRQAGLAHWPAVPRSLRTVSPASSMFRSISIGSPTISLKTRPQQEHDAGDRRPQRHGPRANPTMRVMPARSFGPEFGSQVMPRTRHCGDNRGRRQSAHCRFRADSAPRAAFISASGWPRRMRSPGSTTRPGSAFC